MPKTENITYASPQLYWRDQPTHLAIYAYNGAGKTTLAGTSGLNTVLLDCGDAGAITLRNVTKGLSVVRIRSIIHYLDVIADCTAKADKIDLLVPDTLTGLQSLAIKEVKGKRVFEMNQRKWGSVSSRMIECIAETRNFPKDVLYLVQEKKKSGGEDSEGTTSPALTPSIKGFLSSNVDWVGWLHYDGERRTLDFRMSDTLEAKDRASTFPKLIVNPSWNGIKKRISNQLGE